MFTCERCGYATKVKCNYFTHLQRKTWCEPLISDVTPTELLKDHVVKVESKYQCDICQKCFTCRTTLPRHRKTCREKNKELIELRKQTRNVTNNNITKNISINTFGCENMDYISEDFMEDCLKDCNLPRLFEEIHFNVDHPENHNIRVRNIHKKMLEYFEEGRWIIESRDKILENAIVVCGNKLLETRQNKSEVHEDVQQNFDRFLNKIENRDDNLFKQLKNDLFVCLLKNKDLKNKEYPENSKRNYVQKQVINKKHQISGYIYLIWVREFLTQKVPVFKIGRTKNALDRVNSYPKGSKLMICIHDDNHCESEQLLINTFKTKFIQRTDVGYEYFEGELQEMMDIVYKHCTDNIRLQTKNE